ncbi:MAG: hypothetical protein QN715_09890, partial [Nitrososphaeraceae archaeon]|nr:hypothetical protein [Nitrososphaeraceae archaeon]
SNPKLIVEPLGQTLSALQILLSYLYDHPIRHCFEMKKLNTKLVEPNTRRVRIHSNVIISERPTNL